MGGMSSCFVAACVLLDSVADNQIAPEELVASR